MRTGKWRSVSRRPAAKAACRSPGGFICRAGGVPDDTAFASKNDVASAQLKAALDAGVTPGILLADPAYGDSAAFRDPLTEWGPVYAVDTRSTTSTRPSEQEAAPCPGHMPMSAKELALRLRESAYQTVSWREGTNAPLTSRFAAVRVRTAYRDYWRSTMRPEEWLLIEWPEAIQSHSNTF